MNAYTCDHNNFYSIILYMQNVNITFVLVVANALLLGHRIGCSYIVDHP